MGAADLVEERKIETDKWVFIEGCKNPKAVTILYAVVPKEWLMRQIVQFMMHLMVTKDVLEKPLIVAGGGSPEAYVSNKLKEWTNTLTGQRTIGS